MRVGASNGPDRIDNTIAASWQQHNVRTACSARGQDIARMRRNTATRDGSGGKRVAVRACLGGAAARSQQEEQTRNTCITTSVVRTRGKVDKHKNTDSHIQCRPAFWRRRQSLAPVRRTHSTAKSPQQNTTTPPWWTYTSAPPQPLGCAALPPVKPSAAGQQIPCTTPWLRGRMPLTQHQGALPHAQCGSKPINQPGKLIHLQPACTTSPIIPTHPSSAAACSHRAAGAVGAAPATLLAALQLPHQRASSHRQLRL